MPDGDALQSIQQLRDTAFGLALRAIEDYYNGVVVEQRKEIQHLRTQVAGLSERVAELRLQIGAQRTRT